VLQQQQQQRDARGGSNSSSSWLLAAAVRARGHQPRRVRACNPAPMSCRDHGPSDVSSNPESCLQRSRRQPPQLP
jgi:hypothetical protein